ncbi:MAG: 30S ribosomal protein S20 [Acidobacteriota bacterium]
MANHVSALENTRKIERRTAVNQQRRTRLRHQIRAIRRAMEGKDVKAAEALLPPTFSLVDRAAKWGIIKVNTASRYKSRIHTRLKKMQSAA